MSRTWKDKKGYRSNKKPKHATHQSRGSYEDYDHSDQELYVYDQNCDNCRYCGRCRHTPFPSGWCEYWKGWNT